jgi:hypothetical protein
MIAPAAENANTGGRDVVSGGQHEPHPLAREHGARPVRWMPGDLRSTSDRYKWPLGWRSDAPPESLAGDEAHRARGWGVEFAGGGLRVGRERRGVDARLTRAA